MAKRIHPLTGLALALLGLLPSVARAAEPTPPPVAPEVRKLVRDNTDFAIDLYARLRGKPGNLFFSPVSLSTALAMTLAGARGETASELRKTLHFTLPAPALHHAFGRLLSGWRAPSSPEPIGERTAEEPPSPELFAANRVWVEAGLKLNPAFVAVTGRAYDAPVAALDFARSPEPARLSINRWVEEQTRDKIKELLKPDMIDGGTRLVLTNAIYFKGAWASPFDESSTRMEPFFSEPSRSHPVKMMARSMDTGYAAVDGAEVLELSYAHHDPHKAFSLLVILPNDRGGVAGLESTLSAERLSSWIGSLKRERVHVSLPRFTFNLDLELSSTLEEMGMRRAFSRHADFSGITTDEPLSISRVVQQAFVGVDEKGTEAAAATAVIFERSSSVGTPMFRADHPFLLVLRDQITGSVLFMGRVVDPA